MSSAAEPKLPPEKWDAVARAAKLDWRVGDAQFKADPGTRCAVGRGTQRTRRVLILLAKTPEPDLRARIAAGKEPRAEYLELAYRLGAKLVDFTDVERTTNVLVRFTDRVFGRYWGLAALGALARHGYDDIYATGEDVGLPLAIMLRVLRAREKLSMVGHNLGTPKRRAVLRILGHRVFRYVLCVGSEQARLLTDDVGLPPEKVKRLDYWLDHNYYVPSPSNDAGEFVLSVGMASRDYETLKQAARGLPYQFHVVASGWSPDAGFAPAEGIYQQGNIVVERAISTERLRELYAKARFVVVPLRSVSSAAGVTSMVEAMGMGKAVITSDSPGIRDYVVDGVSGLIVPAGDARALRSAIERLWNDQGLRRSFESHNRKWVERSLNLDAYVGRVVRLLSMSSERIDDNGVGLSVEEVTSIEGLDELEPEWNTLFGSVPDALPFMRHEWVRSWWTHLRRQSWYLRDAVRIFVVRDAERQAVAFAPYLLTKYHFGPLSLVRILQPIGADPAVTELRGMLVTPEYETAAVRAVGAHVRERPHGVDWVRWMGLRQPQAVVAALGADRARVDRELVVPILLLPATWEEFRGGRPRNVRESLRKCYNSLRRDGHEWRFVVRQSPTEAAAAVERFFELHRQRAAAKSSVAHKNCFGSSSSRSFLRDVVQRLAARGAVRIFQLEIDGVVVATRIGFVCDRQLYLYYSGYDPAWSQYSVMTTVVAESIKYAIEQGLTEVNLSPGLDVSKTRWRPEVVRYFELTEFSPGWRSSIAYRAFSRGFRIVHGPAVTPSPANS